MIDSYVIGKVHISMKRYMIAVPKIIADELGVQASRFGCSKADIVRKCLQLGLLGLEIEQDSERKLLLRYLNENGEAKDVELRLLV